MWTLVCLTERIILELDFFFTIIYCTLFHFPLEMGSPCVAQATINSPAFSSCLLPTSPALLESQTNATALAVVPLVTELQLYIQPYFV